jgi:hypothetical protein
VGVGFFRRAIDERSSDELEHVILGAAVVAVAVVLFVVLGGGGNDDKTSGDAGQTTAAGGGGGAPPVPTIVIENGEPVGGIAEIEVNEGEPVHFKVRSDVADEVHVHGYDLHKDVSAGGTVEFDFPATIEGVFEAELEGRKEQILELRVNP